MKTHNKEYVKETSAIFAENFKNLRTKIKKKNKRIGYNNCITQKEVAIAINTINQNLISYYEKGKVLISLADAIKLWNFIIEQKHYSSVSKIYLNVGKILEQAKIDFLIFCTEKINFQELP